MQRDSTTGRFIKGASRPLLERFWSKVQKSDDPDGCWLWAGRPSAQGYGRINDGQNHTLLAHRISWEIHYGPIPKGMKVCHSCDSRYPVGDQTYRLCVRPDHFFLGTDKDNMADAALKGRIASGDRNGSRTHPERFPWGAKHHTAIFLEEEVIEMRRIFDAGLLSVRGIALLIGAQRQTVSNIVFRRNYRHVP